MMLKGKRLLERALVDTGSQTAGEKEAEAYFKQAEERYEEAGCIKPDFVDQGAAVANLCFERAKMAAGFVLIQPECAPHVSFRSILCGAVLPDATTMHPNPQTDCDS